MKIQKVVIILAKMHMVSCQFSFQVGLELLPLLSFSYFISSSVGRLTVVIMKTTLNT